MKYVIYSIHQIGTDEHYIGFTSNMQVRRNGHRFELNHGKHHNWPLQEDWIQLGEPAFEFVIVDTLEGERIDAKKREAEWIAKCGTYNQMIANADASGTTMNGRLRKNMAEHTKRRHAEGDIMLKTGLRKAIAVAALTASDRAKTLWKDPDYAEYQSKIIKERWQDPVFRKTMAQAQTERWDKPEEHAHQRQTLLKGWKSRKRANGLPRGVTRCQSKIERYAASIWYEGRQHYIGTFDTIEEAAAAYDAERQRLAFDH